MTSHSQAAVLVTFEQVGDDVVATWTGSLDAGVLQNQVSFNGLFNAAQRSLYALSGSNDFYINGLAHASSLSGSITSYTGSAGFNNAAFYAAENVIPGSSIYDFDTLGVTQTFGDQTLADIGAASFNNTLAWTSSALGTNTISYTTVVPEPSSTALIISLGALALAVRRRR